MSKRTRKASIDESIPTLVSKLNQLQRTEDTLQQEMAQVREALERQMRPVFVLKGEYATRGKTYDKILGVFSTFAHAIQSRDECTAKGGKNMRVEAVPVGEHDHGEWPYNTRHKIDGALDTEGYVSD
jgi:hypothetical protein